jgi:tetratricopeptide (TPR) repeat protein
MRYSVTVSAAEKLMTQLYQQLFGGAELSAAIRRGRVELANQKSRKVYYNQQIDLEDWLLPVVYQNQPLQLNIRPFAGAEASEFFTRAAGAFPFPAPTYGFHGRDLDVLEIEKRLLGPSDQPHNLLLLQGMGGAGKTTLLRHLAAWWQATHLVEQIFFFSFDQKAHTLQQITHAVAEQLLGTGEYHTCFVPLSPAAGQQMLAQMLRSTRHLLVLDNLESVTGSEQAVGTALPEAERRALKAFLTKLAGGKTLVLLGSRGSEDWLAQPENGGAPALRPGQTYRLGGLDPEAASALVDRVLKQYGAAQHRASPELEHLVKLLDGFPLALEVILPNLAHQPPAEVLAALQAGQDGIDSASMDRTESILRCVDYSHSRLSPGAQELLLCLAPFSGVIDTGAMEHYITQLRAQPALAGLPFERMTEVLLEASGWGLLAPHPELPRWLQIQPVLPYFLRARLAAPEHAQRKAAVETAFHQHYNQLGDMLEDLLKSQKPDERQVGQIITRLEYENLHSAVFLALEGRASFVNAFAALHNYLKTVQDHSRGLALGEAVLARKAAFSTQELSGHLGYEFGQVLDNTALRKFSLKQYPQAEADYRQALALLSTLSILDEKRKALLSASTYHQLGIVAQEQRQWQQAEAHYRQALDIYIEYNDRYNQASTYHQLGRVAEEQRQWQQAEAHYRQALAIYIEYNDRPGQARLYHSLGMVAEEQRQWQQAEAHYRQALAIKIEYNDRYAQASTYHQLGMVAEEQEQWQQAGEHYFQALPVYLEFEDPHNAGIVLTSIARLWQASGDESIPARVGAILGISREEAVEQLKRFLPDHTEAA